jgi:molybdopterin-guanine dinucleotide biosynthesis protein A
MVNLVGLVLCGGESRRMGRDKGLLLKDGIPWGLHIGRKLDRWVEVFYSINQRQEEAYRTILPDDRLITDATDLPGPLNGLFSLHRRMPDTDILLVACDMLDLDEVTIATLISAWQLTELDFVAYGDGQLWQPFCSIYTSRGLKTAASRVSLQKILREGRTHRLTMHEPAAFANYNHP